MPGDRKSLEPEAGSALPRSQNSSCFNPGSGKLHCCSCKHLSLPVSPGAATAAPGWHLAGGRHGRGGSCQGEAINSFFQHRTKLGAKCQVLGEQLGGNKSVSASEIPSGLGQRQLAVRISGWNLLPARNSGKTLPC